MNDLKKIIKGTGIYLIGTTFTKMVQFFLLPIYTSFLTPSEFGQYDLGLAYATFLWTFVYLDIYGAILRFMFDFEENDKNKPIISGLIIFILSTIAYGILILILVFVFHLPLDYPFLLFLIGFLTVLQQVFGYIARGFKKDMIFVVGGILGAGMTFISTIILLYIFKISFSAIYIATILGMLVNICYVGFRINLYRSISFKYFESKLFFEMIKYAAPLSLNSVSYWFLTGFNRIAISNYLSIYDNGLYALVTKFGSIITLFTQAFQMAWQELSFSKVKLNSEEQGRFYSKAVNKFMIFLLLGATLSLPIIALLFDFIVDNQYREAYKYMPLTLLSSVFSAYSSFMASIISTLKKTKYIFTTTLYGSIVNVIVLLILINYVGVYSAIISLNLGFLVTFLRRIQLVKKEIKLDINWGGYSVNLIIFTLVSIMFSTENIIYIILSIFIVLITFYFSFKKDLNNFLYFLKRRNK